MEIDIEKIIDRVIKSSSMPRDTHPIQHDDIDQNAYSDVDHAFGTDVKYIDPVKSRQK